MNRFLLARRLTTALPVCRRGIAATEFALVAGLLVLMFVAIFDLGLWVWQSMALRGALTAGATYAQAYPTATDILAKVNHALPANLANNIATTESATMSCDCGPDTTSQVCPPPQPCAGTGGTMRAFVTLSVAVPFSPLYFTALTTTDAQYVIRVQ